MNLVINGYLYSLAVIWVYMVGWYLVAWDKQDNSWADVAWGLGFVVTAWLTYLTGRGSEAGFWLTLLVTAWGLRLSTHIWLRKKGKPEDKRYAKWRQEWGKQAWWRGLVQVFLLQGFILSLVALPVIWVNSSVNTVFSGWLAVGMVVWLAGFATESVADFQLSRFKADPKNHGRVLNTGLWKYSRHPNYFGEAVMWWAIWLMAMVSLSGEAIAWLTAISPILITFLLLKVSGVTLTEQHFSGSAEYVEYQKTTSSFIPWFKRK